MLNILIDMLTSHVFWGGFFITFITGVLFYNMGRRDVWEAASEWRNDNFNWIWNRGYNKGVRDATPKRDAKGRFIK